MKGGRSASIGATACDDACSRSGVVPMGATLGPDNAFSYRDAGRAQTLKEGRSRNPRTRITGSRSGSHPVADVTK